MSYQKQPTVTEQSTKNVRYIASIIYLLVFSFIVGGSYLNQQSEQSINEETVWHPDKSND